MAEWPACRTVVLDHLQFKSLAMLVNNQLVVFCQLEFLILLWSIILDCFKFLNI